MPISLTELKKRLIERLEMKGMEPGMVPGFMRLLENAVMVKPNMGLTEAAERLENLGWDGFELDYHTLQLAIACFEVEGDGDKQKGVSNPQGHDGMTLENPMNEC